MRRLLVAAVVVAVVFVAGVFFVVNQTSASPQQPLPFSHQNHAVQRQIACEYCHPGARTGMVAGIPSEEVCLGCHRTVGLDLPGPTLLREYYAKKRSIEWVRLTFLPQYVVFAHQPHLTSGVQCLDCHAQGNTPDRWFQPFQPSMAWCLTCHSDKGAATDCWACHK